MTQQTRKEKDSLGEIEVPLNALYGAQTQRAVNNFPISGIPLPAALIQALISIKESAAQVNHELGLLNKDIALSISQACANLIQSQDFSAFPIDVFQTGSGTSSNMNANEVIASLASKIANNSVHPNDHVNMSQSSNDVIPSAIHIAAACQVEQLLIPKLKFLQQSIATRSKACEHIVKNGRTHLMDAMPITVAQELSGWEQQIKLNIERVAYSNTQLTELHLGGTAVGTGINAHPEFSRKICKNLSKKLHINFKPRQNFFEGLSCQDSIVALSGHLRCCAVSLMKICNDIRWMNSGPLAGLAEIQVPAIQPGSSIMPGKVNPVIAEAVCMVAAQVIGNDQTITIAGQSGNFQLNVMLPVIALNVLQSIEILANACQVLAEKTICGMHINENDLHEQVARNPILITALNPIIGYEQGAQIAKYAYNNKLAIKDAAKQHTSLSEEQLNTLLDPKNLTQGGIGNI